MSTFSLNELYDIQEAYYAPVFDDDVDVDVETERLTGAGLGLLIGWYADIRNTKISKKYRGRDRELVL